MIYNNYYSIILRNFIFLLFFTLSINANAQFVVNDNVGAESVQYIDVDVATLSDQISKSENEVVNFGFTIGGHSSWNVENRQMFSDEYLARRPDIKTYKITSLGDKSLVGNLMITENGVWSSIHTNQGLVSIYTNDDRRLVVENGVDSHAGNQCTHNNLDAELEEYIKQNGVSDSRIADFSNGTERNEFRLALVCTGEYYVLNGGNDNEVLDKMAATMLGINTIFEKEISVRFFPIDIDVFRDQNTDPFDQSAMGNRPDEASQGVAAAFPSGNYDIGHVFHKSVENDGWGSGGIAAVGAVCNDNVSNGGARKAKGWSGSFDTDGNGFISLASHEFAHMFGATHTFNGDGGFGNSSTCSNAASATSAYEIGSGTTIMSYQGLCDEDQNIASSGVADNYFHVHSLFQMINFINNQASICANAIPLNNTPPSVNANECGGDILIPKNTPFFLKGSAEDAENDLLLYCWEQYNEDGAGTPTLGQIGNLAANSSIAPLFRSFPPTTEPIRYFPDLTTLAQGANSDPFQVLANRDRDLLFQFTVRDQNSDGGGMATEELTVQVQTNGPLSLENISLITAGESLTVTWNTNNTDALCDKAKLLLSIDGGQTYPFTVAEDFDYSAGNTELLLPASFPTTTEGRLMIACDDSECFSFFDITNSDINISSTCFAPQGIVCDTEYEVYDQGEPALDLDLQQFDGKVVSSLSGEVTEASDLISVTYWNQAQTGCLTTTFSNRTATKRISVDKSGVYSFSIDEAASSGGEVFNIHTASNFNINNLCISFLSSNSVSADDSQAGWFQSSILTAELEACEEYIITYFINAPALPQQFSMPSILGPGNVVEITSSPDPNFSSTFIAVNENGVIEVVSPTSDFRALSGGLYDIYSVSYKSGGPTSPDNVDPSTWAGVLLSTIQSENCMLISSNRKQILVEFTCRINGIELGEQTVCDEISNTYSQVIIVNYESPPITGNLVVNGVSAPITGSPQTITLTGLISDGQSLGVNAAFSALQSCVVFVPNFIIAPENCCAIDFDLGGDQAVCSGESIILDAGNDGAEYIWFKDGLLLEDETASTYEVLETGNYLVEVFNDVGCSKFEVVNISIFETPTLSLDEDMSACEGEIFNLPVSTTATNLQWYKDNIELIGETDGTLLITGPGQYHVIGTNSYSLPEDEMLACSTSDTINIEFVTRPIVDLGADQELCEGEPAVLLDAGQDGTEYTWTRNGPVISGEITDQLSVLESGQYIVTVDKGGGCDAMDTVNITFFDLEEVFAGQDVNICVGNTTQLNPFIDAISFEWYFEGVLYSDQSEMPEVSQGGEYILVGINEIGCTISDTVVVNEVMPPMPDLGDDKIGCIGSEVELGVEGIGNVFWTFNGNPFSMEDTIQVTEAGLYSVSILAANDCNGFDEINVTFEEGPNLSLGDDDSFCAGENFMLNAMTNGDNITWFQDGEEIIGEADFVLSISETGMYSAIVAGASGCTVEDAVMITMNPVPDLDFTDDLVVCDGDTAFIMGPEDQDSYQWTYEGTVISDQSSIAVTEAGQYVLEITNEFGCSDSDVIEVITNDSPTLDLESNFAICEGEQAVIEAISDAVSFQWFVDGEELVGESSNMISLDTGSMIEVIAISADGCTSVATTNVTTVASPSVDLGDDISLCPDDSSTLNAGTHDTYLWSDGTSDSTLNVFSDVTELTTTTYSVTITSNEGCTSEDSVQVTFFPLINGAVELSAAGVCNGEPVQLLATGGISYTWVDDSGTLLNIDGPNATAFPTESTTYQVIIGDDCPGNEAIEIIVIEIFEAGDNIDAGEDDCAVNGKTVDLNASGGVAYLWLEDPTILDGAETATPTVSPIEETIYFVDITDENGCVFRDSVTICISEDPLEFFELISIITPNGDGENDELRFTGIEAFPDNTITIYNRWGYPVFQQKGYQTGGELWNGENGGDILPADTYYYVLRLNGETYKSDITILR